MALAGWGLPGGFQTLHRLMEARSHTALRKTAWVTPIDYRDNFQRKDRGNPQSQLTRSPIAVYRSALWQILTLLLTFLCLRNREKTSKSWA